MKPARRLLWLVIAWTLLALLGAFIDTGLLTFWLPLGIILLVVSLVDALSVWYEPRLRIERKVAHNLPVESWSRVELAVHNKSRRPYQLQVYDWHPAHFVSRDLPQTVFLVPQRYARLNYQVMATRRGDAQFKGVEVEVLSRFQCWRRRRKFRVADEVKVYPNFSEVAKYALLATDNQLSRLGVRQRRRRGQGLEFHQLREFRDGDSLRQIDWKATSRHRKLISREYQDERDQHVVFMIDCGRRMRARDDGVEQFDQSLNAMLLLSYVALRQGDAVSFMAFGGQKRWYSGKKGISHVNPLLNRIYDLETTLEVSDYVAAARELMARQRKRSLVVILTNARDEDLDNLTHAVQLLRTRHLVLIANLREEVLDQVREQPIDSFDQALRYSAVLDYLDTRQQNHERLGSSGAITLNVTARQLPIMIVNRYLEIKRSQML